jgi:hypothetical protein
MQGASGGAPAKQLTAQEQAHAADLQATQTAYFDTYNLLASDAARHEEAQQQASLDQLRTETHRKEEHVKVFKQKAMLVSAENVSKQELIDSMGSRLDDMSKEVSAVPGSVTPRHIGCVLTFVDLFPCLQISLRLSQLSRLSLLQANAAGTIVRHSEDEQVATLCSVFEATMERALDKRSESSRGPEPTASIIQHAAGPKDTLVYFCPGGESKDGALASMTVRLGRATTFREITANAARHFGIPVDVRRPAASLLPKSILTRPPLPRVSGRGPSHRRQCPAS